MSGETKKTRSAAKAAEAEKRQRVEKFQTALEALLKEYNCDLVPMPYLAPDGRIAAGIQIVAR